MKKIKEKTKIIILAIILAIAVVILTGCTDATVVSNNLSQEADSFNVVRRITFVNLRTGEFLYTMSGRMSINTDSVDNQLEITTKIGENKYQKHFLYLANETTYIVEQIEPNNVSEYHYEVVFKPEVIIPTIIH